MKNVSPLFLAAAVVIASASCGTATGEVAPVAAPTATPAEASRPAAGEQAAGAAQPGHTPGDVQFMHGMIAHHQQALAMTSLVPGRTSRQDIQLLARRIELSQNDEIKMMQRWLTQHGEPVSDEHAHHQPGAGGGHGAIPGMLTPEELARLAGASGPEFDRLFLEFMIRHHQGALVMVDRLFSTPGAGQQSEVFQMASHIASDQRVEIARMHRMLLAGV